MKPFQTHTGELISGTRLLNALKDVSDDLKQFALDIRKEDPYASHVSEEEKDEILTRSILYAERVQEGDVANFTVWQLVNHKLTGKCIGLLG